MPKLAEVGVRLKTNRSVSVEIYLNVSPDCNPMLEFIRWLSVSISDGVEWREWRGRDPPGA